MVATTEAIPEIHNITFDELRVGQQASVSRTLMPDDIKAFALVSGDVNPVHIDPTYAASTRFHGVIAHGMWAGALISSVIGNQFPGPGLALPEADARIPATGSAG